MLSAFINLILLWLLDERSDVQQMTAHPRKTGSKFWLENVKGREYI
jgi:hypothetical protein